MHFSNEISKITQIRHPPKMPLDSCPSVLVKLYNMCINKILTGFCVKDVNKLREDSHLPKKIIHLLQWQLFKNDEKCFLFHVKSSFRSQDILIFVITFWACRKNDLIWRIRLISKFITSQPSLQRITTHIFFNISRIKDNQAMKFGQIIEHPKRNIFL